MLGKQTEMEANHLEHLRKRQVIDRYHQRVNTREGRPQHKNTSQDTTKVTRGPQIGGARYYCTFLCSILEQENVSD